MASRRYGSFLELDEEAQLVRWEMDTVVGRRGDSQCLLTLHHKPSHFQIALLLPDKTSESVCCALELFEHILSDEELHNVFTLVLTDNGSEFEDETRIAHALRED